MNEPKRLLDDPSALGSDEFAILAADADFRAPRGAKASVWLSMAASIGATSAAATLSSSAAASTVASGAIAGGATVHALTTGAVVKLVLLGIGIGTSTAVAGHYLFAHESSRAAHVTEPSTPSRLIAASSSAGLREAIMPPGVLPSAMPHADGNRVEHPTTTRLEFTEPEEEPSRERPLAADERAQATSGANPSSAGASRTVAVDVRDESRLVGAARAQLRTGNPGSALQFLDQAVMRFPEGVLTQEREALRIEALMALDRTEEARIRARAFAAAYPKSPHLSRVLSLLGKQ